MRHFQPKNIVEVGSGFSSALMMDVNDLFFESNIQLTFIEPYPKNRLFPLMKGTIKKDTIKVLENKVQEVDFSLFESLEANDILFIDSSHTLKFGSDLSHLFFKIFPRLQSGVLIHLHDIFFPFEYPKEWLELGRAWNEAYFLRAFLMYNQCFEILLFPSQLEYIEQPWFQENMPLCLQLHEKLKMSDGKTITTSAKGQSIWIRVK